MYRSRIKLVFFIAFVCSQLFGGDARAQDLIFPLLVNKFYADRDQRLFWFSTPASDGLRKVLLQKLDSSSYTGTDKSKYKYDQLRNIQAGQDNMYSGAYDRLFTDAAIAYCKDLYQGSGISSWIKYDEWSKKYADKDNDFLVSGLAAIKSPDDLMSFITSLESTNKDYLEYKEELEAEYAVNNLTKARQVATSMNFYRWIHHFNFDKFIVVNLGSATLRYYENDKEILFSKMVVGKPSTRTPRFDASCRDIVLYPYWNVPESIVAKELLPKYRRKPSLIDAENMQVLDAKGNILDPYSIAWSKYSGKYFPYRLRQSTGCDNSLGIIKFDLTSPFGIYLHDTNTKGLFKSDKRYKSHGCMRVEKAIELGNLLLNNKLDTAFLQACIKGEKPITLQLEKPIPVFVVYLTAELNNSGVITYYDDVYHLLK